MKLTSMTIFQTWFRTAILLAICSSLFLSCGKEGPPRPKLYELPAPVQLSARQIGNNLRITLDYPEKLESGEKLTSFISVDIYILTLSLSESLLPSAPPVSAIITSKNMTASLDRETCRSSRRDDGIRFHLETAAYLDNTPHSALFISALVLDEMGKHSKPSPVIGTILSTPPSPPSSAQAESTPEGVNLVWENPECTVTGILRLAPEEKILSVVSDEYEFLDTDVIDGVRYTYALHGMGKVEGVWSEERKVSIDYRDTFPPPQVEEIRLSPLKDRTRVTWKGSVDAVTYRVFELCKEQDKKLLSETRTTFIELAKLTCPIGITAVDSAGNESSITLLDNNDE